MYIWYFAPWPWNIFDVWIPTEMKDKRCNGGDSAACYHLRTSLRALFKITTCGQEAAGLNKGSATLIVQRITSRRHKACITSLYLHSSEMLPTPICAVVTELFMCSSVGNDQPVMNQWLNSGEIWVNLACFQNNCDVKALAWTTKIWYDISSEHSGSKGKHERSCLENKIQSELNSWKRNIVMINATNFLIQIQISDNLL